MKSRVYRLWALIAIATLAACGGGGGGANGGGATNLPPAPTPTPTQTPSSTTNASGTLVDDTTGQPLSGVNVVLYPWTAGSTTVVAQTTTSSNGTFTLPTIASGHYLLVIGSNSPSDTTYATVHDNVTLTGGNQTLKAPTLPAMFGYNPPSWETNGTYRLSKIDANTELPSIQRFAADRTQYGQSQVPVDEWTMENVRTNSANRTTSQLQVPQYISSQNGAGSPTAANGYLGMVDFQFTAHGANSYGQDPRVAWVGINYIGDNTHGYVGTIEAPFDPRGYSDPNYPVWP